MVTIKCNSWIEFSIEINKIHPIVPEYWRGQKDPDWPLASQFERLILRLNGGWEKGASQIYPYDNRYKLKIWEDGFYQDYRDRYLEFLSVSVRVFGDHRQHH